MPGFDQALNSRPRKSRELFRYDHIQAAPGIGGFYPERFGHTKDVTRENIHKAILCPWLTESPTGSSPELLQLLKLLKLLNSSVSHAEPHLEVRGAVFQAPMLALMPLQLKRRRSRHSRPVARLRPCEYRFRSRRYNGRG